MTTEMITEVITDDLAITDLPAARSRELVCDLFTHEFTGMSTAGRGSRTGPTLEIIG